MTLLFRLIHEANVGKMKFNFPKLVKFPFCNFICYFPDKCAGDDDGRGTGVRDPADHVRQAAVRSGREDHRTARGVVLRTTIHRFEGRSHMDQALQKGELSERQNRRENNVK